jgi:signal transduction histidine kinase
MLSTAENHHLTAEEREKRIDSAVILLNKNQNDSLTRNLLRRAATSYFDINSFDKLIQLNSTILHLSEKTDDSLSMGKAYYLSGLAYYSKEMPDKALDNYRSAEKIYRKIGHSDLGPVMLYKAYIFYNAGEFALAESEATMALKLLEQRNSYPEVFQCYIVIASSLNDQDNANEAIYYYNLALKYIEKFKKLGYSEQDMEAYRVICYHNMGTVYEKQKKYSKAIQQYKLALASPSTEKNGLVYSRTINSIAKSRMYNGDTDGVDKMFLESIKISDSIQDIQGGLAARTNLAYYKALKKDTLSAIRNYKQAYTDALKINSNPDKLIILKALADVDKPKSSKYYADYVELNDTLQKVATKNRNKYARIEYETEQLKGENDALVRKNSFIIGVSVVVLLFVAAIFIIYYLNSRNKELVMLQEQQKANEEIYQLMFEQQERVESARSDEKNRIAMELHDGILNNIYAVRLNLEFSNRKSDDETIQKRKGYIKELQSLETEIRAVSHDLSRSASLVQGKDFADMLNFLVKTQKNTFGTFFELSMDKSIDWENMPNTAKVNIYRIIQEAIQNINKYSEAEHANIDIQKDGRQIIINVTDNGVGFDTSKASGGIGMKNLQQRTSALSGLLKIESTPGKGTSINVQFAI